MTWLTYMYLQEPPLQDVNTKVVIRLREREGAPWLRPGGEGVEG